MGWSIRFKQSKKNTIESIKAAIKGQHDETVKAIEANCSMLKRMGVNQFNEMIAALSVEQDYLMSNKYFISDEAAAELSQYAAAKVVAVRGELCGLLRSAKLFAIVAREQNHFDLIEVGDHCVSIIERLIQSSLDIQAAKLEANKFLKIPLWRLTINNLT